MSAKTVVKNRNVGSHWFVSIERELRVETGAKYPDKTVVHASLEGNEADNAAAWLNLQKAASQLLKMTQQGETREEASP